MKEINSFSAKPSHCCTVILGTCKQLAAAWPSSVLVALLKLKELHFCAAAQCSVSHSCFCLQTPALGMSPACVTGSRKMLCRMGRGKSQFSWSFCCCTWSCHCSSHMAVCLPWEYPRGMHHIYLWQPLGLMCKLHCEFYNFVLSSAEYVYVDRLSGYKVCSGALFWQI